MLGAKEFTTRFESDAAFRNKFMGIDSESKFISAARAEGYDLELLNDGDLENVVGGFATLYVFPYLKTPDGTVLYINKPLTLPITTNVASFMAKNANILTGNAEAVNSSQDSFRNFVQNFADNNASCWSKPDRWGNLVVAFCINTGKGERFEA